MTIEYELAYTAVDINRRLKKVDEISTEVTDLNKTAANMQKQIETKVEADTLNSYYTKTETDDLVLITVDEIDAICGVTV